VVAVAGDPSERATFYFGGAAGGVWKTTDAGVTWRNVSDGFFKTSAVGAMDVSLTDPNIILAGMGESTIRLDVSHGDGVYKSADGGRTWIHLGLADTRHIGRVLIHPRNPDIFYVAALGHAFGPNPERGVFRSIDGGATWEKTLFVSDRAGAVDLAIDWRNPDIVYATTWEAHRNFWELSSGGPGSGLWKSTDGGATWSDISRAKGLPQNGLLGKLGVAASPVQAGRVWTIIESQTDPGLYRSDDFGVSWKLVSDNPDLRHRPWYYMHIFADTQDPDTVYVLDLNMWKSTDGGKTFTQIATPHGDNHALWIDPTDNRRMVQGNDGGACVSYDGGGSFTTIYNQLTAQFYRIDVDNAFPYRVYATQQDNSSLRVPSDTVGGGIGWNDCQIAGTGESGFIAVDPRDPDIVYVGAVGSAPGGQGSLQRADLHSGQIRMINVWPEAYGGDIGPRDLRYRFPWTFPILFSPHDPEILYTAGNVVFRSTDEGQNWEAISPDLTRNDASKLGPSGGPITYDTSGAEHYCTLASLRESSREPGVLWAGSDDGLVHITRNGGESWQNITPSDLPEWTYIHTLEPSPHDPAICYLAGTRYKLDDNAPYLLVTRDYGQSWERISDGIPEDDFTRVIRCDPVEPGILYAGTETGLYISLDDGGSWQRWQGNLPATPIYDMRVAGTDLTETDLVVATHGRSLWILDDLTPLRELQKTANVPGTDQNNSVERESSEPSPAHPLQLVPPRPAYRIHPDLFEDWIPAEGKAYDFSSTITYMASKDEETGLSVQVYLDGGEGAPRRAIIHYWLPDPLPEGATLSLEILDEAGEVIRTFAPKPSDWEKREKVDKELEPGPWIPVRPGLNRFPWDLRYEGAMRVRGNKTGGEANKGPFALHGIYRVRLSLGDQVREEPLEVRADPRVHVPLADLRAQLDLLLRVRDKLNDLYRGVVRLRGVREQVEGWRKRLSDQPAVVQAADSALEKLAAIEGALILPGEQKNTYELSVRPRLNSWLSSLIPIIGSADGRPTAAAEALVEEYSRQIDAQLAALERVLAEDVAVLNQTIQGAGAAPVG
jgi:photosystem II stability/assembly factor-like uncharacterized protein